MAPFFLIASFDTDDLEGSHSPISTRFRISSAEIVHLGGKSTETNREKAAREYRRSQLYFYSKHYGQAKLQIVRIYLLVKLALRWVLGGTSRRPLQRKLIELVRNF